MTIWHQQKRWVFFFNLGPLQDPCELRKLNLHTNIQRSMLYPEIFLSGSRMLPREDGGRSLILVAPRSLPRISAPPMPYQLCLHQDWHIVEPQVLLCKRFCQFTIYVCVECCSSYVWSYVWATFCIPRCFFCIPKRFFAAQMLFCIPK